MEDVELESLIQEAGYQFDPGIGRYVVAGAGEGDVDYATEDIADQLEIPIDDLVRWEQAMVDAAVGDGDKA
jgi:hypothetical protein